MAKVPDSEPELDRLDAELFSEIADRQMTVRGAEDLIEIDEQGNVHQSQQPPLGKCISCHESQDDGYEVKNGPGPFCSECWQKLEEHFTPTPPNDGIPKHLLKKPIKSFVIPGSRPELKGLEVAFDADGWVGLRVVANPTLAFILSQGASVSLSQLIAHEQQRFIGSFSLAGVGLADLGIDPNG